MIGTIKDKGPEQSGKWGVMPLPAFPGKEAAGSTNGGSNIVIPAASANVDAAKDFGKICPDRYRSFRFPAL